ncbi:MAG TPA: DUF1249 domain-containing protein [Methylothermaceae bacterium]|nr:DUF1249 domain-containing protein [Methylothermaceae bacterium]
MPTLRPVHPLRTLQELCESNYRKLMRLIPDLAAIDTQAVACQGDRPALYLKLLDRAPYTVLLELSYCFQPDESKPLFEPALLLRVYLDAGMVEVIADHERPQLRFDRPVDREVLEYKWQMNYFLDKWLDHCLQRGYCFAAAGDQPEPATVNV